MHYRELPASEAASLLSALLGRPESFTYRRIDTDWVWNDPVFVVIAALSGKRPPRKHKYTVATDAEMNIAELDRQLGMPRIPLKKKEKEEGHD